MVWLKMVFMAGFTVSQFIFGFLADYFDRWTLLRINAKVLIITGMISGTAGVYMLFKMPIH